MKIIINLIGVGAGNNGGSHTLIQSANTLHDLGQEVVIIDSGKCQYTWDKIQVPYLQVSDVNDVKGDVIIATGTGSINSTNKSKISKKYHWIRGFETWNIPEEKLIKFLQHSPTKKIVNSICLQKKLKQYKIPSEIIRPGHNFEDFQPLNIRKENKRIILGGLFNQGQKRSKKRTEWIQECYQFLKKKYDLDLWLFGSDGVPLFEFTTFMRNPTIKDKNFLYNNVDIWLSPSELEGLHIPPAEAMLTECAVVGNNSEMSGTEDYLIDHETGLVSENNIKSFISCVEILVVHKVVRKDLGKDGRKKIMELGNRKENMKKLINYLEANND